MGNPKEKKPTYFGILMPSLGGWLLAGFLFVVLETNPFHIMNRLEQLVLKGDELTLMLINVGIFILAIPYWKSRRKKLNEYEKGKWDS